MPKCRICGNARTFGVSAVRPPGPMASSALAGLWAEFTADGGIEQVICSQSEAGQRDLLTESPQAPVDTCMNCGSSDIEW